MHGTPSGAVQRTLVYWGKLSDPENAFSCPYDPTRHTQGQEAHPFLDHSLASLLAPVLGPWGYSEWPAAARVPLHTCSPPAPPSTLPPHPDAWHCHAPVGRRGGPGGGLQGLAIVKRGASSELYSISGRYPHTKAAHISCRASSPTCTAPLSPTDIPAQPLLPAAPALGARHMAGVP